MGIAIDDEFGVFFAESGGGGAGEKEWYFFCRRGRKYKNSMRPNRVTRSGFWKATGIDRPIYSSGRECIGLKKSLVYYRGSAGKGTKTDWMMHEFRLPGPHDSAAKQEAVRAYLIISVLSLYRHKILFIFHLQEPLFKSFKNHFG